eukprot:SAG22_NODE_4258_length_1325_cov_1.500000_1_plen_306_part_01
MTFWISGYMYSCKKRAANQNSRRAPAGRPSQASAGGSVCLLQLLQWRHAPAGTGKCRGQAGRRLLLAPRPLTRSCKMKGAATIAAAATAWSLAVAAPPSPNIALILTDDQDLLFDSMRALPFTSHWVGAEGAGFTKFFAHTPVCCPSRGELMTGRYLHNLKAANATVSTCMRLDCKSNMTAFEDKVCGKQLQQHGYRTMMAGKYLNGLAVSRCPVAGGSAAPPAGWDRFFQMCPDTCYVNCLFGDNGRGVVFNDTQFENGSNYAPSLIGNVTLGFVTGALAARQPFFAYIAPHSPHSPSTPAPWYA